MLSDICPYATFFTKILFETQPFSFNKMHLQFFTSILFRRVGSWKLHNVCHTVILPSYYSVSFSSRMNTHLIPTRHSPTIARLFRIQSITLLHCMRAKWLPLKCVNMGVPSSVTWDKHVGISSGRIKCVMSFVSGYEIYHSINDVSVCINGSSAGSDRVLAPRRHVAHDTGNQIKGNQ